MKKRYLLSKKERKLLIAEMMTRGFDISSCKKNDIEVLEFEDKTSAYICRPPGICVALKIKGEIYPCLRWLIDAKVEPHILVDRGAVSALMRGADLMAPGITGITRRFSEGSTVVIGDEKTGVPVAVGIALLSSEMLEEIIAVKGKGKAVKTIHHVGDRYWAKAV